MEKQRRVRYSKRHVFKRRRRIGLLVFLLLTILTLGGLTVYLFSAVLEEGEPLERVHTPAVERAPVAISEGAAAERKAVLEEAMAPEDPTLYLTVPRLGIHEHTVRNDRSEEALDLGAIKLPSTGFPWEGGDTNTYIACHRLGFPGTESYNQCLNLHSMRQGDEITLKDANGTLYRYRVTEFLTVWPSDVWIADPVPGRDMVSLQTCIERPGDFSTLGPNWSARFIARADRVS